MDNAFDLLFGFIYIVIAIGLGIIISIVIDVVKLIKERKVTRERR